MAQSSRGGGARGFRIALPVRHHHQFSRISERREFVYRNGENRRTKVRFGESMKGLG